MEPPIPTALESSTAEGGLSMFGEIEAHLRGAGRLLELVGVTEIEAARLANVVFRLAQRVAVDSGRLEDTP